MFYTDWSAELASWLASVHPNLATFVQTLISNGFTDRTALAYLDRESCTEMKIPIAQRNMLMSAVEKLVL